MADNAPLLDASTLQSAAQVPIQDKDGETHIFGDLYSSPGQHLIIFIRHFYCGNCEDYLKTLAAELPLSRLERESSLPTTIKIVGCGGHSRIADYISRTQCPYPIYTDSERKLYKLFGMEESLSVGSEKPEYIQRSTWAVNLTSTWNVIKAGTGFLESGKVSQNGGEWLFETVENGEVGKLKWGHRMAHTRDHSSVDEIKSVLGLHE